MILGGGVGVTALVLVVTFDIKVIALYVVGIAGFLVASEQFSKYRAIAAAFLGAAMIILGLVLLREAAAPHHSPISRGSRTRWRKPETHCFSPSPLRPC